MARSPRVPARPGSPWPLLVLLAFPSCAGPAPTPPDDARSVLQGALDAWKDGRSADAFAEESGGTRVGEPAWEEGRRLVRYEVVGEPTSAGFDQDFTVDLWLEGADGAPANKQTTRYVVSTTPARTVIRAPF